MCNIVRYNGFIVRNMAEAVHAIGVANIIVSGGYPLASFMADKGNCCCPIDWKETAAHLGCEYAEIDGSAADIELRRPVPPQEGET